MSLAFAAFVALAGAATPVAAIEPLKGETVAIGPWQIEAGDRGDRFARCTMSRTTEDGVAVRFVRDAEGLDLTMSSPRWKLGRDKSYSVDLSAGATTLKANAAASGNAVTLPIRDDKFLRALKLADGLDVKGEGSTIQVALEKSAAGLDRLESCYTKNASSTDTNPFVAPSRKP